MFRPKGGSDPIVEARATLPYKSQQVLDLVRNACPQTVTRQQIIEDCWDGNALVGEKGLNHALWTIRQALSDDARSPRFIQTIARKGYVWIGPVQQGAQRRVAASRHMLSIGLALTVFLLGAILSQSNIHDREISSGWRLGAPDGQSAAYSSGGDIIYRHQLGRKIIMKPDQGKSLGKPSFSSDSKTLAFHLYDDADCELVVVALEKASYEKFQSCPA